MNMFLYLQSQSIFLYVVTKLVVLFVVILLVKEFMGIKPIHNDIHPFDVWATCTRVIWILKFHVMERHLFIFIIFKTIFEISAWIGSQRLINFNLPSHVAVVVWEPRHQHFLVVYKSRSWITDSISVNSEIDDRFHILICQIEGLLHVDFKLLFGHSLSLLVKLAFITHVLEAVHSLNQTGPDLNLNVRIRLGLKIFINCGLFVDRQCHNSLDDSLQYSAWPHDH